MTTSLVIAKEVVVVVATIMTVTVGDPAGQVEAIRTMVVTITGTVIATMRVHGTATPPAATPLFPAHQTTRTASTTTAAIILVVLPQDAAAIGTIIEEATITDARPITTLPLRMEVEVVGTIETTSRRGESLVDVVRESSPEEEEIEKLYVEEKEGSLFVEKEELVEEKW
uniref:Uncharacterized protein n=1 Tax=Cacopsylla melanoneura TaxID=428564 RepID=A0A8D8LHF5_9HEMI